MNPIFKERFRRPSLADPGISLRPVFDDFHRLSALRDYEYPAHHHVNYELILIEKGPYRCSLNGQDLCLRDGQVLVVKPGDRHQDHLKRGQRHYVLHFRLLPGLYGGTEAGLFRNDCDPALQTCPGNHSHEVLFMSELRRESEQGAAYAPAVQDSLLEALFWRTVRDLPREGLSDLMHRLPRDEAQRERILAALNKHLKQTANVEEIARNLRLSPRHFTGLCRSLFAESPARLLLKLRLNHAAELLRSGKLRVKEVSDELGFANPYHFSRAFRRHFGKPPSQAV